MSQINKRSKVSNEAVIADITTSIRKMIQLHIFN